MNQVTAKQREGALEVYENKQAEIEKLVAQIKSNLLTHDRNASPKTWAHVGDLNKIISDLTEVRDRLAGTGEFATKA